MFSFHFRGIRVVLKGVKTSTDFRSYRAFSLAWLATIQIYWNKRKFLHRKKVGSTPHRIGLGHQHGRRLIVSGHQYGGRDVR